MTSLFPTWFRDLPDYQFIDPKRLKDLHAQLYDEGIIQIIEKTAGTGIRAAAHWLRTYPEATKIAYLGGCVQESDVLLCISASLSKTIQGKAMSIAAEVKKQEIQLLILDGVEKTALGVIEQLSSLISDLRWIVIGDSPISPHKISTIKLPPKPFHNPPSIDFPLSQLCLAFLPAGLHIKSSLPAWARHPSGAERVIMSKHIAQRVRNDLTPATILKVVTKFLQPFLRIAFGAPVPSKSTATTLFALRWLTQTAKTEDLSLQAAIATARLHLIWGQIDQAIHILNASQQRDKNPPARLKAMFFWTYALIHLQYGNWPESENKFRQALHITQVQKDMTAYGFLLRKRAEAFLQWGRYKEAEKDLRVALNLSQKQENAEEEIALLRDIAELSITNNETIATISLLERAKSLSEGTEEHDNVLLCLTGLLIHRNDLKQAQMVLDQISNIDPPLLHANTLRRRAELSLAQKKYDESLRFANFALQNYQRIGERIAEGHTLRLLGDVNAATGEYALAFKNYCEALSVQAEIRDVHGLRISLLHARKILGKGHPNAQRYLRYISEKLQPYISPT